MKILIIEPTFVPHDTEPELGPVLLEQGTVPDLDKDTCRKLVDAGKALYTAKSDDPYKGMKTAERELIDAAAKAVKARKAAERQEQSADAPSQG